MRYVNMNPRFRILEGAFIMEPSRFDTRSQGVSKFTQAEKQRLLARGYVDGSDKDVWDIVRDTWDSPPERKYEDKENFAFEEP